MADGKIVDAIHGVSESVDENTASSERGRMGLRGNWMLNIGNMSAMAIVCTLFSIQTYRSQTSSDEALTNFRTDIKSMNDSYVTALRENQTKQDSRWEKTDATHGKVMEKIFDKMDKQTDSLSEAVREMKSTTEEVKRMRTVGSVKGPGGSP
jgi:hypothetical protein